MIKMGLIVLVFKYSSAVQFNTDSCGKKTRRIREASQ